MKPKWAPTRHQWRSPVSTFGKEVFHIRKIRLSQNSTCEKNSWCWQPACRRSRSVKNGVKRVSHSGRSLTGPRPSGCRPAPGGVWVSRIAEKRWSIAGNRGPARTCGSPASDVD
jgi:hypothetical protein